MLASVAILRRLLVVVAITGSVALGWHSSKLYRSSTEWSNAAQSFLRLQEQADARCDKPNKSPLDREVCDTSDDLRLEYIQANNHAIASELLGKRALYGALAFPIVTIAMFFVGCWILTGRIRA